MRSIDENKEYDKWSLEHLKNISLEDLKNSEFTYNFLDNLVEKYTITSETKEIKNWRIEAKLAILKIDEFINDWFLEKFEIIVENIWKIDNFAYIDFIMGLKKHKVTLENNEMLKELLKDRNLKDSEKNNNEEEEKLEEIQKIKKEIEKIFEDLIEIESNSELDDWNISPIETIHWEYEKWNYNLEELTDIKSYLEEIEEGTDESMISAFYNFLEKKIKKES